MVDPPYSDCEKPALKTVKSSDKASDSAVTPISIEGDSAEFGADLRKMSSANSCVPKIVVIDNYGGSHSPETLNVKDALSTKSKRRDKKTWRKDQDTTRASVLTEGQERDGIARASGAEAISCELKLPESGRTKTSLAKASKATHKRKAMERADISPSYTSDEWEADSINSDTDDDHTDSSDDDDPKSQVDRLIERGTLMYMDGENSALSSEDESDDSDDDDDDYDSESDITDVSPLISATASPLGLSPVLPRRTIPTSPLAIHDNRELTYTYDERQCPFNWDNVSPPESITDHQTEGSSEETTHDSSNMDLLLQAVIELENQNRREQFNLNNPHHNPHHHQIDNSKISGLPNNPNDQMFIHPIRDNPHHNHLRKTCLRRKNMSFTNEEVRKIDRDNKILLKKIMAAHTRVKHETSPHYPTTRSYHKPSSSPANKRREEKIRRENFILLKKIQEAKPSKDVVSPIGTMDPLLAPVGVGSHALRSPTNSCGAFMRSIVQVPHVNVPAPRKETAL